MGLGKILTDISCVSVSCADPSLLITQIYKARIRIRDLQTPDDFTLRFGVPNSQIHALRALCEKHCYELTVQRHHGLRHMLHGLMRRPIMLLIVCIVIFATLWLPTKVLFVTVEGNESVSVNRILEKASECGLTFGANRAGIRSEKIKNQLLQAIPELSWAGVNTTGCVATITVRERARPEQETQPDGVCSITALRNGLITKVICRKGNLLCSPGQAVKTGQVLISGYTDCGLTIQAVRADGEIYAITKRGLAVKTSSQAQFRRVQSSTQTRYAVIFQKKRINLFKGSGISDVSCDKMYSKSYVTLPGGFSLPVCIVKETIVCYETEVSFDTDRETMLQSYAQRYLSGVMIAGNITDRLESFDSRDDIITLFGKYICHEMIGQIHSEEIIGPP